MKLAYKSTTTLAAIRAASPCEPGWKKLLAALGKTKADSEPLDLLTVLNSNGLVDALWVMSFAMPDARLARHFQAWCAEQVLASWTEQDAENAKRETDASRAAIRDALKQFLTPGCVWDWKTDPRAGCVLRIRDKDNCRDCFV